MSKRTSVLYSLRYEKDLRDTRRSKGAELSGTAPTTPDESAH